MKGIVFTEFLDLVEDKFGLEIVQKILDEVKTSTNGSYTAVGTYDHGEMFAMVSKLSEISGLEVKNLLTIYGEHFFVVLKTNYPQFMNKQDLFSFLMVIDNYIHPEVIKLYPDAELPKFKANIESEHIMYLTYQSQRKLIDFAIGLINGASNHFSEKIEVEKMSIKDDGEEVKLKISRIGQ